MSYSFKSLAETGVNIIGRDDVDENGNPTGGYAVDGDGGSDKFNIHWQNGPVDRAKNEKPNGAFVEDVLEVCKRRLEHYEKSKFACEENRIAITRIQDAIIALTARRRDRVSRGVLGTYEK